jgi:hypothetical protein
MRDFRASSPNPQDGPRPPTDQITQADGAEILHPIDFAADGRAAEPPAWVTEGTDPPDPEPEPAGDDAPRGVRGTVILVGAEPDLAHFLKMAALPAVSFVGNNDGNIKREVDRRAALCVCVHARDRMQAQTAATWLEEHAYPEKVGVLCLEAMGFDGEPAAFPLWWEEQAIGEGRFDDTADFITQAELRAKWRLTGPVEFTLDVPEPEPADPTGHRRLSGPPPGGGGNGDGVNPAALEALSKRFVGLAVRPPVRGN